MKHLTLIARVALLAGLLTANLFMTCGGSSEEDGNADSTDSGTSDSGSTDAGNTDAGVTDAGESDAGDMDAGEDDAGIDGGTSGVGIRWTIDGVERVATDARDSMITLIPWGPNQENIIFSLQGSVRPNDTFESVIFTINKSGSTTIPAGTYTCNDDVEFAWITGGVNYGWQEGGGSCSGVLETNAVGGQNVSGTITANIQGPGGEMEDISVIFNDLVE